MAHTGSDPYYGHTACLCAHYITHLFVCDKYHTTLYGSRSRLTYFITHTLYQMRLHPSVTFTALLLLQYLKICLPTIPGSFCQCLFIAAFMIASKVISDDKYSNKFWSIIGQGMFQLWKINLWKYLGAEHANRVCFLIRKILTFTFILLHSLLTYSSSHTPHFRYLRSISSLHSRLYLHHLSLL